MSLLNWDILTFKTSNNVKTSILLSDYTNFIINENPSLKYSIFAIKSEILTPLPLEKFLSTEEISFKEKSDTNNHYLFRINKDTYNIFQSSGSGQILKNGQPYFSRMQESDIIKEGYWNKSYYDLLKKAKKKQEKADKKAKKDADKAAKKAKKEQEKAAAKK